jgi:hypothetical protein
MDDLKKAAELIERALGTSFAPPIERVMKKMACNSAAYSAALQLRGKDLNLRPLGYEPLVNFGRF